MCDPNVLADLLPSIHLRPCLAYLDPATGGMLLQVVLGGIGGIAIALKFGWRRFARMLGFSKVGDQVAEESDSVPEESGKRAA